jgi:hypothetical protein
MIVYNCKPLLFLQVLSERNREIKALEKEKHSLAKRISSADVFASPRPNTASGSHPSTPARATPMAASDQVAKCQLQILSPSAGVPATSSAELGALSEESASPALVGIEEGGASEEVFEGDKEVAEEEKRRRLELKAIDSEVQGTLFQF